MCHFSLPPSCITIPTLRVLLIGSGAREHALAWKLCQSPQVEHVFVAPGNGGTATLEKVSDVSDIAFDDYERLVKLAKELQIGLVVVGPDKPVVYGIEEWFQKAKIPCFAPSKAAAQLEGSKTFAKDFMQCHSIPTARYANFDDLETAKQHVQNINYTVVIKASGLAAGKGVILPSSTDEALQALDDILLHRKFGDAGAEVVIEEDLKGQEISILTLSDGKTMWSFPAGQDHKRALDGDQGLNTGGMGVYAPVPFVTEELMKELEQKILKPTFEALRNEGTPFHGCLFTGIMLTASGPKVLEYNTRFGDPETQSMLLLLDNETDFAAVLLACTNGTLNKVHIGVKPNAWACNVVIAAGGYPEEYRRGDEIFFDGERDDIHIFHGGTKRENGKLLTNSGRVLSVAAVRSSLKEAVDAAYEGVKDVKFEGMHYRRDIALKALRALPNADDRQK